MDLVLFFLPLRKASECYFFIYDSTYYVTNILTYF